MWTVPRSKSRTIIRTNDPFIIDRIAVLYGLGFTAKAVRDAVGFSPTSNASKQARRNVQNGLGTGGDANRRMMSTAIDLVLFRIARYYKPLDEARATARELLWKCGGRTNRLLNTAELLYVAKPQSEIAADLGMNVRALRNYFITIYRHTGSINRMNAAVRLAGISEAEWTRCMAQKGSFLWEQTST